MLKIFDKLEKNVCRVFLDGKGNGTGFLISNRFILTDYHVVEDGNIEVKFHNDKKLHKVTLVEIDMKYQELDIALLELPEEIDFYEYINIKSRELKRDERWVTRGYTSSKSGRAEEMRNDKHVIHQHLSKLDDEGFDIELNFDTSKWSSYRGLSGSPIVVDNCIVGIITSQQIEERSKELYGLSVEYFKELIDELVYLDDRKEEEEEKSTSQTNINGVAIYFKKNLGIIIILGIISILILGGVLFSIDTKNECLKIEPISLEIGKYKEVSDNTSIKLDTVVSSESCIFQINNERKKIELDKSLNIKINNCQYEINILRHTETSCDIKFTLKGD
jgi:hypothetical protein